MPDRPGEQFAYLTTTGRRTGLPREIEIWYVEHGERLYMLSERPEKAHWVQNVRANPMVTIRWGGRRRRAWGRVLDPEKDAELYNEVRELSEKKYGWGDGLPVEFRFRPE
jgi:deazaflavin-dependent oxidoreductase (nitroreductase family)